MPRRGRPQRLSKLQSIILEELQSFRPDMTAAPEQISLRIAKRHAPKNVWSLEELEQREPSTALFARSFHKHTELAMELFRASFSRSLKNLEKKHLVQLVRGKYIVRREGGERVYYRIETQQPRVSFIIHHKSPYFGKTNPDIEWLNDVARSIYQKLHV